LYNLPQKKNRKKESSTTCKLWQKSKGGEQRNSVLPLLFYRGLARASLHNLVAFLLVENPPLSALVPSVQAVRLFGETLVHNVHYMAIETQNPPLKKVEHIMPIM
jgi:hypothetical protein